MNKFLHILESGYHRYRYRYTKPALEETTSLLEVMATWTACLASEGSWAGSTAGIREPDQGPHAQKRKLEDSSYKLGKVSVRRRRTNVNS